MHSQKRISGRQFGAMVTAGYLVLGVFYFPRPAMELAGREALWSLWLAAAIIAGLMVLMFRASVATPDQSILTTASRLMGKPVGIALALFTIAYHLLLAITASLVFSFVLVNVFLPNTPLWAVNAGLIVSGLYVAWNGILGVARTIEATYTPVVVLSVLALAVSAGFIHHPALLLPPSQLEVIPILRGAWPQFLLFIGFQVSLNAYPYVRASDRTSATRYALYGLFAVTLFLTLAYEIAIATLGPSYLVIQRWPLVSLLRLIALENFFVNKLGLLIVVLWTVLIVLFMAVRFWCLGEDVQQLLGLEGVPSYRISTFAIALTAMVTPFFVINGQSLLPWLSQVLVVFGLLYLTVVPLTVLTAVSLRPKKVQEIREIGVIERGSP